MVRSEVFKGVFKFRNFEESFKLAITGIGYLFLYHRNMRIIFLSGIMAFFCGMLLKLKGIELVALFVTVTLVYVAEMFNTAIELIIDMFLDKRHPSVKLIKDVSAGVVLIASLNALAIGYMLFAKKIIALWK